MNSSRTTPASTTRFQIEERFREAYGRDLTPEERRLLGWADVLMLPLPPIPEEAA